MSALACSSSSPAPANPTGGDQGGSQQQGSGGSASTGTGGEFSGSGGASGSLAMSDASTGNMTSPDATFTPGSYKTVLVYQSSRNAGAGSKPEHCDTVAPLALHTSGASTR